VAKELEDQKKISLSEIEISPVKPRNGLLAFASFVLADSFFVGDVAVYSRLDQSGYRLVYPMKTLHNGARVNVFHPIRKGVAQEMERQVTQAYEELLAKVDDAGKGKGEDNG
jgi:DNA-binding cell septation regulator SpoVG